MNMRRYERVPFFCKVGLSTPSAPGPVVTQSFDISLGGVGVATRAAFQTGDAVVVTFFLKDHAQQEVREQVAGRVANLRADEDGNRLGIEFLSPLRDDTHPHLMQRIENLATC